ncbi:MAG: hypothetical protein Wins2KO_27050 [Winogradskyella sp.]
MKTLQTKLVAILVLFLISCNDKPTRINEGIITSKQTIYSSIPEVQEQFDKYDNTPIKTYFKKGKSRVEITSPIIGKIIGIVDANTMKSISFINGPSGKLFTKNELDNDRLDELLKNISVEVGSETKVILGYECQQYIVTIAQDSNKIRMEMFVTPEIEPVFSGEQLELYKKIDGFPMYMVMEMNQFGNELKRITEVIDLEVVQVSDDKFDMTPPEDYKEL